MSHSVIFKNVTKKYKMYANPKEKLKGVFFPDIVGEEFYALQNVSFTADKGDVIGVIGVNGAGKSTLSNLLAGITPSTKGEIKLNGQASLIAINSGLDTQLTGRENIELKCLMLGFSKKETIALMPGIEEFADIGKFINQPVKNYSSGMKSRLGFAISINIDPDILVIDEALSVGDKTFASKCLDKMNEFKEQGKTIFFISHSIGQIKKFCQKALWLEAGVVKDYGTIKEVVPKYEAFLKEYKAMSKEEKSAFKKEVNEKRSKPLELHHSASTEKTENSSVGSRVKRSHKKSLGKRFRLLFVFLIVVFVVGGGVFAGFKYNLVDKMFSSNDSNHAAIEDSKTKTENNSEGLSYPDQDNKQTDDNQNTDKDFRYVNVDSAYVRSEHSLESVASAVTGFGDFYCVEETYSDDENDIEWLQIASEESEDPLGWISSKLMTSIKEKVSDDEVVKNLSGLLGLELNDRTQLLGKNEETLDDSNRQHYSSKDGIITSVTLNTNPALKNDIVEQLGKPQMEIKNAMLYLGDKFDYVIDGANDNTAQSITISKREIKGS